MTEAIAAPQALSDLWNLLGGDPVALDAVSLTGSDPVLPSTFAVGTAAQASIAAATLAAREIGVLRGGPSQRVTVDMRHAAVEFRSERHLRIDGEPLPDPWDDLAGLYRAADGAVRLHTNFPHHREGILKLLGCDGTREAVTAALLGWKSTEFELAAAKAGMCASALRTPEQWDAHPQAKAVAAMPALSVTRLDASPLRALQPLPQGARPLHGLRVLDLTRVIAGPVAGRTLAAHGADVMLVTASHLPAIDSLVKDTGRGKRSTRIDLRTAAGRDLLKALVKKADVFLQGYRPGGLAALGFSPEELAKLRPGIVCASLSAYGASGPWAARRAFDSLVQTASGLNVAEARAAGQPGAKVLPAQVLDHASGYLLAFGIQRALARRATEGGSWHVQVSLAQTGHWLRSLGVVIGGPQASEITHDDVQDLLDTAPSGFGMMTAVRHAGRLQLTPAAFDRPAVPLGTDSPVW